MRNAGSRCRRLILSRRFRDLLVEELLCESIVRGRRRRLYFADWDGELVLEQKDDRVVCSYRDIFSSATSGALPVRRWMALFRLTGNLEEPIVDRK